MQKKIIPARRSDVFEAWTKPEIMSTWLFPALTWTGITSVDLRVGGRWRHEMIDDGSRPHSGHQPEAGKSYPHWGEYLEVKPPERLVFTWNSDAVKDTRVTIELRDLGASTELTLTHELIATDALRAAHTEGWTGCLDSLTAHFSK